MAVHRRGSGPDLVLFHGGMGSWKHWVRNVEPLATRFTVHALDHPSYGDSAPVPRETTGPAYLDFVHALVVEQDAANRVIPHAVVYFTPDWVGPSGHAVQVALAQGAPHIYVQQGAHQGGYVDEIAVDPINLQPGDEAIVAARLREELTRVSRAS